jgi:hypothetical protein
VRRTLEQAFLRRRAGRVEALLVIERESGARERITLQLASVDLDDAARAVGRQVARAALADRTDGVRVRVERAGDLSDDPALGEVLTRAFEAERRRDDGDADDGAA